jgi:hypothetical protein
MFEQKYSGQTWHVSYALNLPFAHDRFFTFMQAWNFFFDKKKQMKNDFFVQTWGSRPQKSIVTHEGDLVEETKTHKTLVKFDIDSFSTVAAVTNMKPLNPSSAFEIPFRTRRFMYYEVTIESEPDAKSMLQIGWTIASRERNGDEVSDDYGTGDFPHSWGFDGIRSISYNDAEHLLESYKKTILEQQTNLATLIPTAKDLIETQIQDILENRRSQIDLRDEKEISKTCKEVQIAIHLLRSRISLRRNIIAQMQGAKNLYENSTPKPSVEECAEWKKSPNVNVGLLCFHSCIPGLADCSVAYLSDEMETRLNSENPPSYRWIKKSVIGVWFDADSLTMGIVRSVDKGGKQTLFSRSETDEFFDDKNSVTWKEADIVPCISGRGVDIKINLGISEGVGNDFKFFDEERIVFRNSQDLPISSFDIKSVKSRIFTFSTPEAVPFKDRQFIRLEFPPKVPFQPTLTDAVTKKYTMEDHGLKDNQFVHFVKQKSCNDIEEGTSYIVNLKDCHKKNEFRLVQTNLKEKEPYKIRFDESDPKDPKQFKLVFSDASTDELHCSDPIFHPQVFLKEETEVGRVEWGPYGENQEDVTKRYHELYETGLRQIGYKEAIYKDGKKIPLSAGLKDFFQKDSEGKVRFEGEVCYLRVFRSVVIPDIDDNLNIKCAACLGFAPPSRLSAVEIANFAFADGKPVIPDYHLLSDIVFCSSLPSSLRSSCVELLRSCFIDQDPWFLTPPINTIRAIGRIAPPAVKNPGAYLASKMQQFKYKHSIPSKGFGSEYCCYDESDDNFFDDLFNAAAGNQKVDDEVKKEFLLGGFNYPSQSFQLCTRDIAIFWGRVTSQLRDKSLKDRFISQKNQDCKIFLKNLVYCLLDTLKFEFDESWTGIIKVRTEVVRQLERVILSYFKQTEIAQMVAGTLKKEADEEKKKVDAPSTSHVASGEISHYTSRVPKEIIDSAKYIEIKESKLSEALAYYTKHSQESCGYYEWSSGIDSKGFVLKQFSYDEVSNTICAFQSVCASKTIL